MLERHELSEHRLKIEPKKIVPRHRALMRQLIAGMSHNQAAEYLGFTPSRVSIIVNSPLFQAEMKVMEEELRKEFVTNEASKSIDPTKEFLSENALKAAKTMVGALDDDSASARISAAKDILDRTGYAADEKVQNTVTFEPSQALLNVLNRINVDAAAGNKEVIDIESMAPAIDSSPSKKESEDGTAIHSKREGSESKEVTAG